MGKTTGIWNFSHLFKYSHHNPIPNTSADNLFQPLLLFPYICVIQKAWACNKTGENWQQLLQSANQRATSHWSPSPLLPLQKTIDKHAPPTKKWTRESQKRTTILNHHIVFQTKSTSCPKFEFTSYTNWLLF